MKKKGNVFPDGFLWGGATGATQYEGGFDQGGRGPSNFDYMCRIPDAKEKNIRDISELTEERYYYNKAHENALHFPYRKAVDFYGHYKEDIALMAEMGFKVFRMSISWSRIYPTGEEAYPNKEGIQFYHNVFDELRKYQIEPLVTMTHYELPAALVEKYNGWQSEHLIDLFVKYAKTLIDEYKDKVKYWITFNEINALICHPYASGGFFVERTDKNYFSAIYQALHHQYVASALAVKYLHETAPDCKMGSMIARLECYPYTCKPTDVAAAFLEDQINYFSFDIMARGEYPKRMLNYFEEENIQIQYVPGYEKILKENTVDFLALSYYMSYVVSGDEDKKERVGYLAKKLKNPYIQCSDWGWGIDPEGLRVTLNRTYDKYQLPIFIVENGLGTHDKFENGTVLDDDRILYLKSHIQKMGEAIVNGVEVMGYAVWGCIDLVSSTYAEMEKRYGFVYVDAKDDGTGTYNRYRKKSFHWYQKVIESNGEDLEND